MLVVVFAGGDGIAPEVLGTIPPATVIAADSGASTARAAGLVPDHLVGDFDSIDPATMEWAVGAGVELHRYPEDKDATDLELGLELAMLLGASRIIVAGGHGGRFDHLVANLALLTDERWQPPITWLAGNDRLEVVRGRRELEAPVGATISVLAASPATGVTLEGLRWRLDDAALAPGSTRGVSNVVEQSPFVVMAATGTLVVVVPDHVS